MFRKSVMIGFDKNLSRNILSISRQVSNYKGKVSNKKFKINDNVYVRGYSKPNKMSWKGCVVDEELDNNLYVC